MNLKIDLELNVRQQIAQLTGMILADLFLLYTKTLNFHWNIVDPRFYFLHKFLEEQYEQLAEILDDVAERIRALGEKTPATLKKILSMTSLKEPANDLSGDEMLQELLHDHEAIICQLREKIEHIDKLRDAGTVDLLTNCLRFHEKSAWMLRSHLKQGYL